LHSFDMFTAPAHLRPPEDMEVIARYFPNLPESQLLQLDRFMELLRAWNEKINVVSRKDIGSLELHHVVHAMAIARWTSFAAGTRILDIGTGGGLPGIPLAILFPECHIHMIDARRKKITVVNDIIEQLGLTNASASHERAEDHDGMYDFVVSRAVTTLDVLFKWSAPLLKPAGINALPNGCIVLKGGDIEKELRSMQSSAYVETQPIRAYFDEAYFDKKYLVYLQD
jgi:16S rRNA (guanine527-N7)-methyltransferase